MARGAIAELNEIETAAAELKATKVPAKNLEAVGAWFDGNKRIGYKNLARLLMGWTPEEVKAGKRS